ncbi:YveK family protein [Cohnella sp. GCM10027633]|uniref:YveK family protein n=1 Tax=unclassified Cohnella TaxID=2636738 RepID=UPI00362E4850
MDLIDHLRLLRRRLWLIVTIVVVLCAAAIFMHESFERPQYQAINRLIVSGTNAVGGQPVIDQGNLTVNVMLLNTYKELIATPPILEEVVRLHPELQLTSAELAKKIKVSSAAGSPIMTIAVQDESYAAASRAVNALTSVFRNEVPKILRVENVVVLNESDPAKESSPIEESGIIYVLLIALIVSSTIAVLAAYLLEYANNRFNKPEDIEKWLELPVLGSITAMKRTSAKAGQTIATYQRAGDDIHVRTIG